MSRDLNINLDAGPDPNTPYIEQELSTPIYTGAQRSRLNFIIKILSWQSRHKVSDIAMDDLLKLVRDDIVPKGKDNKGVDIINNIPKTRAEARKVIRDVGFDYVVIDACPCDEFIYYGEREQQLQKCPREGCGLSRYRTDLKATKVPRKKFHYFPITPRLLAFFRSPNYAPLMQWAGSHRSEGDWIRYPQDGMAWKRLETLCPFIKQDPRNVVLGIATDGFNPFGHNSASHSTWPLLLVIYNLPPELAIKAQNILLALIIPGKSSYVCFSYI